MARAGRVAEHGIVTRALMRLAGDRDGGGGGLARRICEEYVAGLDMDGAALSLLTASDSRETLWATDATADRLEDLQFTLNEGACIEAAVNGHPVLVPDLHGGADTARWPVFAAAVAEQTLVGALFALPLRWGVVNLGVLDLYRVSVGALSTAQQRDALAAADLAALLLLGRRTDPAGATVASNGQVAAGHWLDPALGHRAEIHQATGMVLAQLGIDTTAALARLRAHAYAHDRLLIDVARDVVERRLVFTEDMT